MDEIDWRAVARRLAAHVAQLTMDLAVAQEVAAAAAERVAALESQTLGQIEHEMSD